MKMRPFLRSFPRSLIFFFGCFLLLPLLLLLLVAPSSSGAPNEKVTLSLYYESLCPYCAHGDDECFLNTIEACAITIYPDVVQHFRFVRCLERLILEGRHNQWVNCFQMTGLGTSPIDCYTNGNGKADYQNFVTYICRAYKGNVIPNACRSLSTRTNDSNEKVNSFLPVCYVDEARNLTLPLVITRLLSNESP
ncbi:hypothetical protein glysoja_037030 [Glycine soja]|uniref:Gamma-interferon-inducible lysosomal thiol reductase n=1 Tax=Glycine soja TaxID=3848 RepID=A0A0B2PM88_GLYSO|nr:hypothetical protein glysoja_037030 [Glycine soja]